MSGRAGRRGLDPTGTVIIVANDECPEVRRPFLLRFVFRWCLVHSPPWDIAKQIEPDDSWQTIQVAVTVPPYVQHDPESASGRSSTRRGNDQAKLFRKRLSTTSAAEPGEGG